MGWLGTWAKRRRITINCSGILTSNETDFPVPVYLSASSGIDSDDVSDIFTELGSDSNRKKIAVTTSDGTTQCYVEIQQWDHADSKAWLHVKVPTVSGAANTILYIYFDSSQADNATYVGDTGEAAAQAVWDQYFVGVYHFEQDPSSGGACILDSTSNENDGTPNPTLSSSNLISSPFGRGLHIDQNDTVVSFSISDISTINSEYTQELILQPISATDFGAFAWIGNDGSTAQGGGIQQYRSTGYWDAGMYNGDHQTALLIGTNWQHDAWELNDSYLVAFKNGVSSNQFTESAQNIQGGGAIIGATSIGGKGTIGKYGEYRISIVNRSLSWLKATHAGLFDELLTFGSVENGGTISGTVSENGTPVQTTVRVYLRSTGVLIEETTSAADGSFSFMLDDSNEYYVIALDTPYNALIFDKVVPV